MYAISCGYSCLASKHRQQESRAPKRPCKKVGHSKDGWSITVLVSIMIHICVNYQNTVTCPMSCIIKLTTLYIGKNCWDNKIDLTEQFWFPNSKRSQLLGSLLGNILSVLHLSVLNVQGHAIYSVKYCHCAQRLFTATLNLFALETSKGLFSSTRRFFLIVF